MEASEEIDHEPSYGWICGIADFTMAEVDRDRYFSTPDEMIKRIDQPCIVPFIQCIPDILKSTFRKEVIDMLKNLTRFL